PKARCGLHDSVISGGVVLVVLTSHHEAERDRRRIALADRIAQLMAGVAVDAPALVLADRVGAVYVGVVDHLLSGRGLGTKRVDQRVEDAGVGVGKRRVITSLVRRGELIGIT